MLVERQAARPADRGEQRLPTASALAEEFVCQYRSGVLAQLRRLRVPADDWPDLCQEILADAVLQLRDGQFEGRATVQTWLYCIARGKAIDYWRRIFSRNRAANLVGGPHGVAGTSHWSGPELKLMIGQLLASWPPHHREAFGAFYLRDEAVESIAARIGRSVSRTREILTHRKQAVLAELSRDC